MRPLPKKLNPLILPDASPDYEELLARRRLGKTNLTVKPAHIGTSNATKPENLGLFEYAHLRAPLPKDLKGSEIFPSHNPQQHPETYFLMRRSKDGYISATGMFKIAFPWAKLEEEKAEREHLKSRPGTSEDEIAGNVWIPPMLALELSKEYHMFDWVRALLDPTEIAQSPTTSKKQITPPPRFELPAMETVTQLSLTTRTRGRRSASPSKTSSPRKAGSPRKSRQTKAIKETAVAASNTVSTESAALQSALDTLAPPTDLESVDVTSDVSGVGKAHHEQITEKETQTQSKKATVSLEEAPVTADVDSKIEVPNGVETTEAINSAEPPVLLPDLPSAADTEKMIAEAKQMVEEAIKPQLDATEATEVPPTPNRPAKKRKSMSDELDEEGEEDAVELPAQPTKKARILEDKLRRERVRNRALIGVTATLALAATIPYFL